MDQRNIYRDGSGVGGMDGQSVVLSGSDGVGDGRSAAVSLAGTEFFQLEDEEEGNNNGANGSPSREDKLDIFDSLNARVKFEDEDFDPQDLALYGMKKKKKFKD